MSLAKLSTTISNDPLPAAVESFLAEAEQRIDSFQVTARVPGFVPSDPSLVYKVLRQLVSAHLLPGPRFCEWGCGFGVMACLASMLGLNASGIEIDESLAAEARRLAADFDLPVEVVQGSFVPVQGESLFAGSNSIAADGISWMVTDGNHELEDIGFSPDEFDLIYVYPWPDEEHTIRRLFDRFASVGAILAVYQVNAEISLYRKRH